MHRASLTSFKTYLLTHHRTRRRTAPFPAGIISAPKTPVGTLSARETPAGITSARWPRGRLSSGIATTVGGCGSVGFSFVAFGPSGGETMVKTSRIAEKPAAEIETDNQCTSAVSCT